MFRIFEKGTNTLVHEESSLEKAIRYAELYRKNIGKSCTIMKCETIWTDK